MYYEHWSHAGRFVRGLGPSQGVTRERERTAPGDTLQGVTPEGIKIVGKFTKNSGEMRSNRLKKVWGETLQGVTPE